MRCRISHEHITTKLKFTICTTLWTLNHESAHQTFLRLWTYFCDNMCSLRIPVRHYSLPFLRYRRPATSSIVDIVLSMFFKQIAPAWSNHGAPPFVLSSHHPQSHHKSKSLTVRPLSQTIRLMSRSKQSMILHYLQQLFYLLHSRHILLKFSIIQWPLTVRPISRPISRQWVQECCPRRLVSHIHESIYTQSCSFRVTLSNKVQL